MVHRHELEAEPWDAVHEPLSLLFNGDVSVALSAHPWAPRSRIGRVRREAKGPQLPGIQRDEEWGVIQGPRLGAGCPRLCDELRAVRF